VDTIEKSKAILLHIKHLEWLLISTGSLLEKRKFWLHQQGYSVAVSFVFLAVTMFGFFTNNRALESTSLYIIIINSLYSYFAHNKHNKYLKLFDTLTKEFELCKNRIESLPEAQKIRN